MCLFLGDSPTMALFLSLTDITKTKKIFPERTPQRRRGRKNVAKGRAQAYRDLAEMKEKLAHALRKAEKYKKRSDLREKWS